MRPRHVWCILFIFKIILLNISIIPFNNAFYSPLNVLEEGTTLVVRCLGICLWSFQQQTTINKNFETIFIMSFWATVFGAEESQVLCFLFQQPTTINKNCETIFIMSFWATIFGVEESQVFTFDLSNNKQLSTNNREIATAISLKSYLK
jgi:hypothetical protein